MITLKIKIKSETNAIITEDTINSININSKRPKIIKLHGDYLYDNIKSSLRETESLETNIKNKLIELSKNTGLIVIGYAGSDRSIMDTLNFLLSNHLLLPLLF